MIKMTHFSLHLPLAVEHLFPPIFGENPKKSTLQGTNISPKNGVLKMIFLFPRWDMLIPWRVPIDWPFSKRRVLFEQSWRWHPDVPNGSAGRKEAELKQHFDKVSFFFWRGERKLKGIRKMMWQFFGSFWESFRLRYMDQRNGRKEWFGECNSILLLTEMN